MCVSSVCVCVYVVCACVRACVCVCVCVACVYMYKCVCASVCMHVCVRKCEHVSLCAYVQYFQILFLSTPPSGEPRATVIYHITAEVDIRSLYLVH